MEVGNNEEVESLAGLCSRACRSVRRLGHNLDNAAGKFHGHDDRRWRLADPLGCLESDDPRAAGGRMDSPALWRTFVHLAVDCRIHRTQRSDLDIMDRRRCGFDCRDSCHAADHAPWRGKPSWRSNRTLRPALPFAVQPLVINPLVPSIRTSGACQCRPRHRFKHGPGGGTLPALDGHAVGG